MLFSRAWLGEYVELPADAAVVAERLTFAGFNVDSVAAVGKGGVAGNGGAAGNGGVAGNGGAAGKGGAEDAGDVVFDVDVTTNRPDCMNHLGLARELAVLFERPLRPPPGLAERAGGDDRQGTAAANEAVAAAELAAAAAVEIEDPAECPRFVARVVEGVRVGPSPPWLVKRLAAIGQRSINNVVDVTNFVLWEMGQPMHAYDLDRLAGARLVVRRARPGERLVTLDGVERALDPELLVIADGERPVGLAGVMGGRDSEVAGDTARLLLESAHFERRRVRLAAKRLGLHTDASHRFERGVDLEACRAAADRAAALIVEIAGGRALAGAVDRRAPPPPPRRGRLELARLNAFAGAEVEGAAVERWLRGLGFAPEPAPWPGAAWEATVPSWRWFDFEPRPDGRVYEADLFEEVLRIHGLDSIPAALPALAGSDGPPTRRQRVRERVRRFVAGVGFAEAINFAWEDPQAAARLPVLRPELAPLALLNPLSERAAVMRRSLLANLVESARFNQHRGAAAVRLFEIGSVFYRQAEEEGSGGGAGEVPRLPLEEEHVALVCGGRVGLPWDREVALDLFDLKGVVEGLAATLGVRLEARPAPPGRMPGMLAGSAAEVLDAGGEVVGALGRLEESEGFPLYACELRLAALEGGERSRRLVVPSRFPGINADFTLTHALGVSWREIEAAIEAARPPELVELTLKARYQGEGVPAGAVNTTITFSYNAGDRSMTQDEVNERQLALAAELSRRFGWQG
jgi:phenylalanyl-tRNA synthetase beta chain